MPPAMKGTPSPTRAPLRGAFASEKKGQGEQLATHDVNMVSHQGSSGKTFEEMNAMFDGDTDAAAGVASQMNAYYMGRKVAEVGRVDWPQVPGKPAWPGKGGMQEFKPVFQGPRTEQSMAMGHTSHEVDKYRKQVNGIVPGYAGHVPRSRDQYGESSHGGLAPVPWGQVRHMGAAVGHYTNAQGQIELSTDEKEHQKEEERFATYDARNGGVMPNYAGHRPGARAVEATAAFGKWKVREGDDGRAIGGKPSSWAFNDTSDYAGETGSATAWSHHTTGTKDSYRKQVGGVLPGYKGFVPGAIDKHGGSHFGGVRGVGVDGLNTIQVKMDEDGDYYGLNQKGHGRDHKEHTTGGGVKSGYAGHLPGARDTWGMTHYDTIHMTMDGQLLGKAEFANDGEAGDEFVGQAKHYHDDVSRALHEH